MAHIFQRKKQSFWVIKNNHITIRTESLPKSISLSWYKSSICALTIAHDCLHFKRKEKINEIVCCQASVFGPPKYIYYTTPQSRCIKASATCNLAIWNLPSKLKINPSVRLSLPQLETHSKILIRLFRSVRVHYSLLCLIFFFLCFFPFFFLYLSSSWIFSKQ